MKSGSQYIKGLMYECAKTGNELYFIPGIKKLPLWQESLN